MYCTSCKNEILEGSMFCNHCGAMQCLPTSGIQFETKQFVAKGEPDYLRDDELLNGVNEWLAQQALVIATISYECSNTTLGEPIIENFSITYTPCISNDEVYQIDYISGVYSAIGDKQEDLNEHISSWKYGHPDATIISNTLLENKRNYKIYILYIAD